MEDASLCCEACGMPNSSRSRRCVRCAAPLQPLQTWPFLPSPGVSASSARRSNVPTGGMAPNTLLKQRYLILRCLGQGGMGAVYKGYV